MSIRYAEKCHIRCPPSEAWRYNLTSVGNFNFIVKTYLIGDEEVRRYAQDIADRLSILGDDFPTIWCPLGISGETIAKEIGNCLSPELRGKLENVRLTFDRKTCRVSFDNPSDEDFLRERCQKPILIIDSSVHSGTSMQAVARAVQLLGASRILSYTLVLKRGSSFVPMYFGLLIDDTDRAFFQLDKYPTNRLFRRKPFGILRKLTSDDVQRTPDHLETGVPSIDKMTWGDLLYDREAKSSHVYLYEHEGVVGAFVSFKSLNHGAMFIDGLATDENLRDRGVGGMLLRWAETWARSANYRLIVLWAIEERIPFYRHAGFEIDQSKLPLQLGHGETYTYMSRELLYNIDVDDGECVHCG